jgi:transposase
LKAIEVDFPADSSGFTTSRFIRWFDHKYGTVRQQHELVATPPYIAFKSIHTGRGGGLWHRMFHLFHFHREDFLQYYHKRSNVESTFSMIKAKFRDHVRRRRRHNICCLIQESHELGIETTFWADTPA